MIGVILSALAFPLYSESVTLEECETSALSTHPLSDQSRWINLIREADTTIAALQYLPKLSLAAKATRQSEALSATLPGGITLDGSLNQFQIVGELNQIVFDGGAVKAGKKVAAAASALSRSQNEVNLEAVRRVVRETYFSLLLLDRQLNQIRVLQQNLFDTEKKLLAYKENGMVTQADINEIKVEELNVSAQILELETRRKDALYTLSRLTGLSLSERTTLIKPQMQTEMIEEISHLRKEFSVYRSQIEALDAQQSMLNSSLFPKISLFAQGGYSEPGLNMLDPDPAAWWLVGIRGFLSLDSYYTYASEKSKIEASKKQVETQIEQFILQEDIRLHAALNEIDRLEQTIELDEQIIAMKQTMKEADEEKIASGSLSVSDLIQELNELTLAEMVKAQHEVQLLRAQGELSLITGNGENQ